MGGTAQAPATAAGSPRVRRHADAASFLARAEAWLLEREAEHNLILGIAAELRAGTGRYGAPIYLATVEQGDAIVGCAFRTPPYKVGLTRMPEAGAAAVARDVSEFYASAAGVAPVLAVLGAEQAANAFAAEWHRLTGAAGQIVMRNRIYALTEVADGLPDVPGTLRSGTEAEIDLIAGWVETFSRDANISDVMAREGARRRLRDGSIVVWEVDRTPVSMAAAMAPTPHGIRIGYVFTPRELRGRGYATTCVAALSRRMLAGGRRFCFLYTDLANPTSNAIYERIGYRSVCDVVDVAFDSKDRHGER